MTPLHWANGDVEVHRVVVGPVDFDPAQITVALGLGLDVVSA